MGSIEVRPLVDLGNIVQDFRPDLKPFEAVYRDLHRHPELGLQERRTASIAAEHLRHLGFNVTTDIGGHGLAGVLHNGAGPTVMLRAEMDALPIREATNLPYASKDRQIDSDGEEKPVMHACGHDTHVVCLMAASTLLTSAKDKWSGTLIALFQPNEEHGAGARAMVYDNLYQKIPMPDILLAQHVGPDRSGKVSVRPGLMSTASDSFKITIIGKGGHGAYPQETIDPVVLAAYIIVRLQTIAAREISPLDSASVTVGSIHGGATENVVPDEVEIKTNVRTFDNEVREKVLSAIKRIVKAESEASGVETPPKIEQISHFPLGVNDPQRTYQIQETFRRYLGPDNTLKMPMSLASDDVSELATPFGIPMVLWGFGGTDPKTWDEAQRNGTLDHLPKQHTARWAPVIEPTLKTGIDAIALAALTFLTDDVEG